MNGKLKNSLAIAGFLSIMTLTTVNAAPYNITESGDFTVGNYSNITTSNQGNGGVIQNSGYNLNVLTGTSFTNNILEATNQAVFGGAIYQVGGNLTIQKGVTFDGNRIIGPEQTYPGWSGIDSPSGGAIYAISTQNLNIGDVKFLNNVVSNGVDGGESNGGAIFLQGVSSVTMWNVEFSGNSANTRGGAIYNGDSALTINGTGVFSDNTAKTGGAIYMYDVTGTTVTSTGVGTEFNSNNATGNGGAVANFDSTFNVGKNNTFSGNTTAGNGGAIYNASFSGTSQTNIAGGTTFSGNSAAQGGAVYNSGSLNLDSYEADITFSGNTATAQGGGASVYLDGTSAQLNINGEAGTVSFQDNGAIAGSGTINKSGAGTVEFVGNTEVAAFTGKYIQNNGVLKLTDSTMFNNYNINLGEFNLTGSSTAIADGVNKVIKDVAGVTVSISNGASLKITSGTLGMNNKIALGGGGVLNVSGSTVARAAGADVYFKGDSLWEGDVNNAAGGSVILDGYTHSTSSGAGNYTQTGGDLTLQNGSELTIGNADSSISGGNVNVQSGNTLNVESGGTLSGTHNTTVAGDLNVNNGGAITGGKTTIANNGKVNVAGGEITKDATVDIQSGSELNISNGGKVTLDNNDKWAGKVSNDNSTLTLDGVTHNTQNGAYEQNGGTLNLENNSNLTLGNNGTISNGQVNVNDSSFVVGNGGEVTGGKITVGDGSSFNVQQGGVVSGGQIDFAGSNVTATVNGDVLAEAIFDVTSGNTVVINAPANVTLNNDSGTGDAWTTDGTVQLNGGTFNFTGTTNGTNGIFKGNNGNLNITSGSQSFIVAADSYIKAETSVDLAKGSSLDVAGGDVVLNNNDIWEGTVNSIDGNLTLSNVSKNAVGVLKQDSEDATTTVVGNFTMNNADDTISKGTLNVGTASQAGTLTQNTGTVSQDASVNIASGSKLNVQGGETTLNTNGDGADSWNGTVQLGNTGVLNLKEVTQNDKLEADGGTLNINSGSAITIASGSFINNGTQMNLDQNASLTVLNNGTVNYNNGDDWQGLINLQNGGTLNYSNTTGFDGTLAGQGGNFNSTVGSVLNIGGGSYIGEAVKANILGDLNISGTDADNTGYVTLSSGDTLLGNTTIDSYGVLNLGDNVTMAANGQTITFNSAESVMNLETNNKLDLKAELVGADGQINKNGSGDVKFSGGTSQYQGNLLVNNSGDLTFVDEDGFGGNLLFGDIIGKEIGIIADKIHGEINQNVDAEITYSTYRDIDLNFNDKVNVLQGELIAKTHNGKDVNFNSEVNVNNDSSLIVYSGRNVNFNSPVNVTGGTAEEDYAILALMGNSVNAGEVNAENSIIYTSAKNSVFSNLSLTDSTLQIAQNGFTADNLLLSGNSNVYLMNGVITDNNIGNLTVDDASVTNFSIDISPRDWTSDKILAGAVTTNGIGGTLNVSDFQFINKCPIDRHVPLQIFDTSRPGYENILFTATDKEIRTPIGYYGLFPSAAGNGMYNASLTRYVPEVFRGQVATMSTWQNQLTINNLLFDHVQEINMQYLSQSQPNKYAALYPQFAPYQYDKKDGSLWFKPFGTIEKLNMTQGLNVNNTFYGALIGADFPAIELKRGWTMLPTAYIGYTGAHQSYDGVGMYQNGGQAGAMATFMKNDFIGSIMAFGGGYSNRMDVGGVTDNTGNWIAGTAAKAAYNFHPSKHFIIQPTVLASYTYLGQQNWHSNYGDMSMRAEMLNGVNVAPGINFIYGRETWSIYATVQYFYNVLGYTGGLAGNDVDLPHLRMRHGFIQYGIGATKTWKDRFSGFLQIVIRNGGRTGVGFMGGITFKL